MDAFAAAGGGGVGTVGAAGVAALLAWKGFGKANYGFQPFHRRTNHLHPAEWRNQIPKVRVPHFFRLYTSSGGASCNSELLGKPSCLGSWGSGGIRGFTT
eukprot:2847629-Amphidinium_carterae.1